MSAGVIASIVAPHTPRIGIEAKAPPFQAGLIAGLREMGQAVRALKPDLFVLLSAHWVSTFNWYVTSHDRHQGICIADEAPDLIPGVEYDRAGDPAFAKALAGALNDNDVPCGQNDSPHFAWDYGTYVPLHYLDPESTVPVVAMPTVLCSDLAECRKVGNLVHQTAQTAGKRVVFVASCAMAHAVRRGPELWPSEEHQALDRRFIELINAADIAQLAQWVPEYCKAAVAEMGGRPILGMIGAAEAMAGMGAGEQIAGAGATVTGHMFGEYAQSSGSGNAALALVSRAS